MIESLADVDLGDRWLTWVVAALAPLPLSFPLVVAVVVAVVPFHPLVSRHRTRLTLGGDGIVMDAASTPRLGDTMLGLGGFLAGSDLVFALSWRHGSGLKREQRS